MSHRPNRRFAAAIGLAVAGLTVAACGAGSNDTTSGSETVRTIEIEMRDIAFSPTEVTVPAGETVRFVFRNTGQVTHDAFIGDEQSQDEHEMQMGDTDSTDMGGMDHGSASSEGGITVEAGGSGEITHTFRASDQLLIGCHQPGHYAAGMKVTVDVS